MECRRSRLECKMGRWCRLAVEVNREGVELCKRVEGSMHEGRCCSSELLEPAAN